MKKRIGAVLLVLGLLVGCISSALSSEPESVIVQVEAGNLKGSGVIYTQTSEFLIVATAAHVLTQNAADITVTFSDDFMVSTYSYYMSASSDLAFINVPLVSIPDKHLKKYIPVQVDKAAFDAIQSGDEVMFLATDSTCTGTVLENWIYVEDFAQYMLLMQGDIEPGMSGGGVFDIKGNFLGILCGESEKGEVAAVPLSIIEAEYLGVY